MKIMKVRERLSNLPRVSVVSKMRTRGKKPTSVYFKAQFTTMLCFINELEETQSWRCGQVTRTLLFMLLHWYAEAGTDAVRYTMSLALILSPPCSGGLFSCLLDLGLAMWLALSNRMNQKWWIPLIKLCELSRTCKIQERQMSGGTQSTVRRENQAPGGKLGALPNWIGTEGLSLPGA